MFIEKQQNIFIDKTPAANKISHLTIKTFRTLPQNSSAVYTHYTRSSRKRATRIRISCVIVNYTKISTLQTTYITQQNRQSQNRTTYITQAQFATSDTATLHHCPDTTFCKSSKILYFCLR